MLDFKIKIHYALEKTTTAHGMSKVSLKKRKLWMRATCGMAASKQEQAGHLYFLKDRMPYV